MYIPTLTSHFSPFLFSLLHDRLCPNFAVVINGPVSVRTLESVVNNLLDLHP